jgi:uncharacterized protein (TIGR03067 family)
MRWQRIPLSAAAIVVALGSAASLAQPTPGLSPSAGDRVRSLRSAQDAEKAKLRGAWGQVSGGGGAGLATARWTFEAEVVHIETGPGGRQESYRYQLNPLRNPPELTLYGETGLVQGIYTLEGDRLTVATSSLAGVERPRSFEPKAAGTVASPVVTVFGRVGAKGADWEGRAAAVLAARDEPGRNRLAAAFQELPPATRAALPVRIRPDAVEVTVRGDIPVEAGGPGFMEYLVAGPEKAYETLFVATPEDLRRLLTLRPFFDGQKAEGRRHSWSARVEWVGGGEARSIDLGDLVAAVPAADREVFLDDQEVDGKGQIGGETRHGRNVTADLTLLPAKSTPGVLRLTLRFPPPGR